MVVTLDQQYHVGEKPTVVMLLRTYINPHTGTPDKKKEDKTHDEEARLQFVTLSLV